MAVNPPRQVQALCGVGSERVQLSGWRDPRGWSLPCPEALGGAHDYLRVY